MPVLSVRWSLLLSCVLVPSLAAGCGDDGSSPTDGGPSGDAEADATASDGGMADNGVRYDEVFEGECLESLRCSERQVETACVCVREPRPEDLFATNRVGCDQLMQSGGNERTPDDDDCVPGSGDGAPQLGCFMPEGFRAPGESEPVTLYGVVDVFGNGGDSNDIGVEVYREGTDGALGELLGSTTATVDDPCSETEDEISNDEVVGTRNLGFYRIADIPSETPLIVRTVPEGTAARFWRSVYSYNVYIEAGEIETGEPGAEACEGFPTGPRAEYRASILSSSDWQNIPNTAGLPAGIGSGNGVVAGEIHDCGDVRLEFALVSTTPEASVLAYFNDNPDNPLPELSRGFDGTSLLGLYAALDVPAGPVDVAAVGRVDGETVSLGWYRAQVFEGAVTALTLQGLRPHQTGDAGGAAPDAGM